jgi:hypothetical protein
MGGFNAKIRKEECQKKVAGKCSIHDTNNENGNLLGQFATRNGMKVKITTLLHKSIHLGMLKIPGSSEVNRIDHC